MLLLNAVLFDEMDERCLLMDSGMLQSVDGEWFNFACTYLGMSFGLLCD